MTNLSKNGIGRILTHEILQGFKDAGGSAANLFTIVMTVSCFYKDRTKHSKEFRTSVPDLKTAALIRGPWINKIYTLLNYDAAKNSMIASTYKVYTQSATGSILHIIQGPPVLHYEDGHLEILQHIGGPQGKDAQ